MTKVPYAVGRESRTLHRIDIETRISFCGHTMVRTWGIRPTEDTLYGLLSDCQRCSDVMAYPVEDRKSPGRTRRQKATPTGPQPVQAWGIRLPDGFMCSRSTDRDLIESKLPVIEAKHGGAEVIELVALRNPRTKEVMTYAEKESDLSAIA